MHIAPSTIFEACGIPRAAWSRLRKGEDLNLDYLRKLSKGLSIPLLVLCLESGMLSFMEVANAGSPFVKKTLRTRDDGESRQFWRLSDQEGRIIRLLRHASPRGRDLIEDVSRGQVRLNFNRWKEDIKIQEIVETEVINE